MISIFLKSLIIGYSGAIMPGPMFTYTVDKSMRNGAKTGLLVSLGHAVLELALVILIFLGAGKYLETETASTIIGITGGLILEYMGFGMLKDVYQNRITLHTDTDISDKQGNIMLAGVIISATNPYFIIWWSAVGLTLIMNSYKSLGVTGIVIFYLGHVASDISWFTFVSLLVSKTRHLINIKVFKFIIVALALCLFWFGTRFLIDSLTHFLRII